MAVKLSPLFNEEQFDNSGLPLSGGLLYWYQAGTTTPQATYTDITGLTPQPNPIVLNTRGEPPNPIWLTAGQTYKAVLQDSLGNTLRTVDNISGVNDTALSSNAEWAIFPNQATFVTSTSFTLAGDQTALLTPNRRLKAQITGGTWYGTIVSAIYTTLTTVTVSNDSITLDSGLSSFYYAILAADHPSVPALYLTPAAGDARYIQAGTAPSKNRIINGSFRIFSRGSGGTVTAGGTIDGSQVYITDRWFARCTGNNITATSTRILTTPNYGQYRMVFTGAASVTGVALGTRLENFLINDLPGNTASLQIKASSSSLTSLTWTVYAAYSLDLFSTPTLIATGAWTINSTEAIYSAQISVPNSVSSYYGMQIEFTGGALGAGQTLTLGDVQLEKSNIATGYEYKSIPKDQMECARYFQRYSVGMQTYCPASALFGYSLPIFPMRTSPTLAISSTTYTNASGLTVFPSTSFVTNDGVKLQATATAAGACAFFSDLTADAEL